MDSSVASLNLDEISQLGTPCSPSVSSGSTANVLASSRTNTFNNVLQGASITIQGVSDRPVTVNVTAGNSTIATQVQSLVTYYNKFIEKLAEDIAYNEATGTKSVLTGDPTALQLNFRMTELFAAGFTGQARSNNSAIGH